MDLGIFHFFDALKMWVMAFYLPFVLIYIIFKCMWIDQTYVVNAIVCQPLVLKYIYERFKSISLSILLHLFDTSDYYSSSREKQKSVNNIEKYILLQQGILLFIQCCDTQCHNNIIYLHAFWSTFASLELTLGLLSSRISSHPRSGCGDTYVKGVIQLQSYYQCERTPGLPFPAHHF